MTKESIQKLVDIANHILAMKGDAYLEGHPEWSALVDQTEIAMEDIYFEVNEQP